MNPNEIHSRSLLAGYDPALLAKARVLVVGLGALGQNILQTLTLSGVGHLLLVDFDRFDDHNATRSPFFPTPEERVRHEGRKASCVAVRAFAASTAAAPEIRYSHSTIQRLGDGAIRWADVVVSAVDSLSARAWLAERAKLHGKPMAEGGFSGADYNFSAFSGRPDDNCYRCFNPDVTSSMSCRQYAAQAERHQIIPAIQATASVLGGLLAEQVMNILHGTHTTFGERFYGNLRQVTLDRATLTPDPRCPGEHRRPPVIDLEGDRALPLTVTDLVERVRTMTPAGWLLPSEPVLLTVPCTDCGELCATRTAESAWMRDPRCADCGGPWPRAGRGHPGLVRMIDLTVEPDEDLGCVELAELGIGPGGFVEVAPVGADPFLLHLPGALPLERVTAPA